ncbi:MAG: hypothetical protein NZ740_03005 [Kiritimatiellae bacterium]|nr:hypothetical protein [Kiritimatiellia bacterium]MDW8458061.1 hypothetical protein [Verrucomicrobiota bacterium]
MIAWSEQWLRIRRRIRLREPQFVSIVTGAPSERIDAEYDAGNRLVRLIIHTRSASLSSVRRRWSG